MKKIFRSLAVCALLALVAACGGGGGSSGGGGGGESGISLPSEVSAVPPQESQAPAKPAAVSGGRGLARAVQTLAALADDLPSDSDYKTVVTSKYVDERTLEVFGILETIFKAIDQTHYADPANVGAGPYSAAIAWYEDRNGTSEKTLEEWTVRSDMTTEDGVPVNVLKAWIDEPETDLDTKALLKIYRAPTQAADGTYLDYGKWVIQASPGGGVNQFYADADVDENGQAVLRLSESNYEPQTFDVSNVFIHNETKAVMFKSPEAGYGKASMGNWEVCWNGVMDPADSPCLTGAIDVGGQLVYDLPLDDIAYAYNNDYLALDVEGEQIFKNRNSPAEIAYQYGIFNALTGEDLRKTKTFGFSVRFDEGGRGYYGSWQGRHNLWANGAAIPDGTACQKETWGNQAPGETFTVKSFGGTLVKRTLVDATLEQIEGIPLEIWLGKNFNLMYVGGTGWVENRWDPLADNGFGGTGTWVQEPFTQMSSLVWDDTGMKQINISRWDNDLQQPFNYLFDGTNLLPITAWGNPPTTGAPYTPQDGDNFFVWISGRTYIEYTTLNGWEEKDLQGFDTQTWTPTFGAVNKGPFEMPMGQEYYVNNKGLNYVVKHAGHSGDVDADYPVKAEIQSVATPANAATFLSGVSYLATPWDDPATRSTYELDSDPLSDTYMLLVYETLSAADTDNGKQVGDVVTQGFWGLMAYNASDESLNVQFNWEYASESNSWGRSTYLVKDSDGEILYLDDPVAFDPVALADGVGNSLSYILRYDGWLHGLPDMRWELQKNNYVLTEELKKKVVSIPEGTVLEETGTGTQYLVKPLEVGVVLFTLDSAPEGAPDLSAALAYDLATFDPPAFAEFEDRPAGTEVKYVEGVAVE